MKMFLILVSLISVIGCQNNNSQTVTINQDSAVEKASALEIKTKCDTLDKITALIQQAIDISDVQQYYEVQKTISQPDFIIAKNNFINDEMVLNKFGSKVKLLSEDEIKSKKHQAFIRFEKLSIKSDTADVFFEYPIQGLGCEAVFTYSQATDGSCQWKLLRKKLFEYK